MSLRSLRQKVALTLVEAGGRFKVISVGDVGYLPLSLQSGVTGVSDKTLDVPR